MRNHFLRAKGVTSTGGGGDSGGGGGATCGANDSGGTNEWAFGATQGLSFSFSGQTNELTASIDTANKISYLATEVGNNFYVRKITNTGTLSWGKKYSFSITGFTNFQPSKGKSLSTGKQVFAGRINVGSNYSVGLICINADSTVEWCKRFTPEASGNTTGKVYQLTIDSSDNIYCIFEGKEPNADGTASSNVRFFVMKLNSSGVIQWQKIFRSLSSGNTYISSYTHPNGLVVDGDYLYITNTRNNAKSQQIVTLNVSNGAVNAVKHFGSDGTTRAKPAQHDYMHNCDSLIKSAGSGEFVMLYPAKDSNNYRRDIFITKFDSSYSIEWSTKFSVDSSNTGSILGGNSGGYGLTVTPNAKNVIVTFLSTDNSDFSHKMFFIMKFDSNGTLDWQRLIRGVPDDGPQGLRRNTNLESDNADHFYICAHLPFNRKYYQYDYSFYYIHGSSVLKHTSCSAIPTGYFFDEDFENILSSITGNPDGFAKVESTSRGSQSSASCVIQSTAFSDDSSFGSVYTSTDPTGDFTASSVTVSVSNIPSTDNYEDLSYL